MKKSFNYCFLFYFEFPTLEVPRSWFKKAVISNLVSFFRILLYGTLIKYYVLSKVHRISTISALSENIWRIIFPHWVEKVYSSSHYESYYLPHNNVAIFTRRKNLIGRKKTFSYHLTWHAHQNIFPISATYLYLQDVFQILSQHFFLYLHLKIGILTFVEFFRRFGFR